VAIMSGNPIGACRGSGPILLISQYREDEHFLREVLTNFACPLETSESWQEARPVIHSHVLSVVVTESELPDGTWRDVLSSLDQVSNPPLLIVVSRLADERLWAEVLNQCGFDVLAKPFARDEVIRVLGNALDTSDWLPKRPPGISERATSRRKSAIGRPARCIGYGR
jgi:DNA-binding NtrC family response regulator